MQTFQNFQEHGLPHTRTIVATDAVFLATFVSKAFTADDIIN